MTRVIYPPGFDPEAVEAEARRAAIAAWIKPNGRYMDFAGNISEHGPVDMVQPKRPGSGNGDAPIKLCPQCEEICHASARVCHCCGWEFVFEEKPKFQERPTDAPIISSEVDMWRRVTSRPRYTEKPSKVAGQPPSVQVDFTCGLLNVRMWLCPQHHEHPQAKSQKATYYADRFWRDHGGLKPFPKTVEDWLLRQHELLPTAEIEIEYNGRYPNAKNYKAANDNAPAAGNDNWQEELADEIPF